MLPLKVEHIKINCAEQQDYEMYFIAFWGSVTFKNNCLDTWGWINQCCALFLKISNFHRMKINNYKLVFRIKIN